MRNHLIVWKHNDESNNFVTKCFKETHFCTVNVQCVWKSTVQFLKIDDCSICRETCQVLTCVIRFVKSGSCVKDGCLHCFGLKNQIRQQQSRDSVPKNFYCIKNCCNMSRYIIPGLLSQNLILQTKTLNKLGSISLPTLPLLTKRITQGKTWCVSL